MICAELIGNYEKQLIKNCCVNKLNEMAKLKTILGDSNLASGALRHAGGLMDKNIKTAIDNAKYDLPGFSSQFGDCPAVR